MLFILIAVYLVTAVSLIPRETRAALDRSFGKCRGILNEATRRDLASYSYPPRSYLVSRLMDEGRCETLHVGNCKANPTRASLGHMATGASISMVWPFVLTFASAKFSIYQYLAFINRKPSPKNALLQSRREVERLKQREKELEQELKIGDYA